MKSNNPIQMSKFYNKICNNKCKLIKYKKDLKRINKQNRLHLKI